VKNTKYETVTRGCRAEIKNVFPDVLSGKIKFWVKFQPKRFYIPISEQ
jgi:hypothetical protein